MGRHRPRIVSPAYRRPFHQVGINRQSNAPRPEFRLRSERGKRTRGGMIKTALALTSVAIIVGALSTSTTVAATCAPSTKGDSHTACIELRGLPRSTAPGETTLYGHIASLVFHGGRYLTEFDPALWLTGLTSQRAALADTGSRTSRTTATSSTRSTAFTRMPLPGTQSSRSCPEDDRAAAGALSPSSPRS